jgi:hypothetical protein
MITEEKFRRLRHFTERRRRNKRISDYDNLIARRVKQGSAENNFNDELSGVIIAFIAVENKRSIKIQIFA